MYISHFEYSIQIIFTDVFDRAFTYQSSNFIEITGWLNSRSTFDFFVCFLFFFLCCSSFLFGFVYSLSYLRGWYHSDQIFMSLNGNIVCRHRIVLWYRWVQNMLISFPIENNKVDVCNHFLVPWLKSWNEIWTHHEIKLVVQVLCLKLLKQIEGRNLSSVHDFGIVNFDWVITRK